MKNILILSSEDDVIFENIVRYFKPRKDINIKLLYNISNSSLPKKAKKLSIEAIFVANDALKEFFEDRKFDLVAILNFNQILSEEILSTNTFINVHPSLLPKYRGLRAIDRAFVNHDIKTGITFHYLNKYLNEGKIIYQKELIVQPKWTIKKLEKEIKKLIIHYYPRIIERFLGINILLISNNEKRHALLEKISKSKILNKLFVSTKKEEFYISHNTFHFSDFQDLIKKIHKENIRLVIVDDEKQLNQGIVDFLNKNKITTVGTSKKNTHLESSKFYAKKLMQKYKIKTAPCKKITNTKDIDDFILYFKNPIIKANGLTTNSGVYENKDIKKVKHELFKYLSGKYDDASKLVLIEQKLSGTKITLYSMWDGEYLLHFPLCQSFKKNAQGLYTKGLASICPIKLSDINEKKLEQYKIKLLNLLKQEKITDSFIICSELMICSDDIYVIEYNVRFSALDAEVLLNHIQNDWLNLFYSCSNKMLNSINLIQSQNQKYALALVGKGYPLKTRSGLRIKNLENVNNFIKVYFSNIIKKVGEFYSDGGRILSVVSDNRNAIYKYLKQIDYEEKEYSIDVAPIND